MLGSPSGNRSTYEDRESCFIYPTFPTVAIGCRYIFSGSAQNLQSTLNSSPKAELDFMAAIVLSLRYFFYAQHQA